MTVIPVSDIILLNILFQSLLFSRMNKYYLDRTILVRESGDEKKKIKKNSSCQNFKCQHYVLYRIYE